MMKKTSVIYLLFISLPLLAGDHFDRGVLRILNEGNQQKLIPSHQSLCLNFTGTTRENLQKATAIMNECAMALCGLPEENESVFITDKNFEKYVTGEVKKQIAVLEPNLKKVLEKEKQKTIAILNELQKMISAVNPEIWSPEFKNDLSHKVLSRYLQEKIDLKKPVGERFSITLNDESLPLSPELKNELLKYKDQYIEFVKSDVNSFLEKGLYSESEQRQMAKTRLLKLQKDFEIAAPSMNKYEREDVPKRIADALKEIETVASEELSLSLINMSNIEDQVGSYLPPDKVKPLKPTCESAPCNEAFKKYFKELALESSIEKTKKEMNNPAVAERQLAQCKAKIVAKLSISSDLKNAEKLMKEVKKAISKNVFSKFSSHSKKLLEDYLKNNLVMGSNKMSGLDKAKSPFEDHKAMVEASLNEQSDMYEMDEETALGSALSLAEDGWSTPESTGVCSPKLDSNAFDTYLSYERVKLVLGENSKTLAKIPPKDQIFISPFSCNHDLRGKSVVAHELGHAINQIFHSEKLSESSAKSYKEIRKCSTDNYVEFIPDRGFLLHEGDGLRTEEDTADIIAYMAYSDGSDLFSCAMIKPSMDNKSYDDLALIYEDGDSHSTSLYRVINEAINKNRELPVSCLKALEPLKEKLRLKKCVP